MYQKLSLLMGWRWEEINYSRSEIGGFKEAQASIKGELVLLV
jgi:protein subunit release factor A